VAGWEADQPHRRPCRSTPAPRRPGAAINGVEVDVRQIAGAVSRRVLNTEVDRRRSRLDDGCAGDTIAQSADVCGLR